jgi:hypothetical protein
MFEDDLDSVADALDVSDDPGRIRGPEDRRTAAGGASVRSKAHLRGARI